MSEILSRASDAVGTDYVLGRESWVGGAQSGNGPDCSGFVQKVWEVPDTLWYKEENPDNTNYNGYRFVAASFGSSSTWWNHRSSFSARAQGDALVSQSQGHVVLLDTPNYGGYNLDSVYEAPDTGLKVRRITKDVTKYSASARNYLEALGTNVQVVDNPTVDQSGPDSVIGWRVSTSNTPYSGENYQYVYCNETAHARWVPYIAVAGNYKVYVRYSTASSRTAQAAYQIHYTDSSGRSLSDLQTIDQRSNGGTDNWVQLGTRTYYFAQGWSKYNGAVDLYSPTGEGSSRNIVIDAMKFVKN